MRICFLFAMFLSGTLFAQQPAPVPPNKGSIAGAVTESSSGKPLQGTEVNLTWQDPPPVEIHGGSPPPPSTQWTTTTDVRGSYEFRDLAAGRYSLWVHASGYGVPAERYSGAQVRLAVGTRASDVNFALSPETSVRGRTVDPLGKPVPRAGMAILREQYVDGRKQWVPMSGAVFSSDERGEFHFAGVWSGPVIVQAMPMRRFVGTGFESVDPDMPYFATYFPGTIDLSKATRIEVAPGKERGGIDVKLLQAPVHRVRGSLRDHQGRPAGKCMAALMPRNPPWGLPGGFIADSPDGAFEFKQVPAGPYLLIVDFDDARFFRQEISIGADTETLEIRLPSPVRIEGEILGKPELQFDPRDVLFSFAPDMEGASQQSPAMASTDGRRFVLEGILPGRYRIGAMGLRLLGLDRSLGFGRIEYGSQDVIDGPVDITATPARLLLTLTTDTGSRSLVSGTVTRGNGVTVRSSVWLLHADPARRLRQVSPFTALTDEQGRFLVEHIVPGEYLAFAFEETEAGFWKTEERFREFAATGKKVSVPKNGSVDFRLEITPLPP